MNTESIHGPVCLVTGVGDGTGAAVVRRFVSGGYRVAMIARDRQRLDSLVKEIPHCFAYPCDVSDLEVLQQTVADIKSNLGPIEVLIHNVVAHTFGDFLNSDPRELEYNFRVNTTSLLYLARMIAPQMIAAARGAIVATGNTASHRGIPNYALFAPTKAAQRILCESLARDLGPKRVHVGYVTVDAPIDVNWLGSSDEERPPWLVPPENWPWPREDFFSDPKAIANEIYHVAHQHHTTWAFDTTVRPFAEKW